MGDIRYAARIAPDGPWCFGEDEEDALDCLEGEGDAECLALPTHKEVCPRCRGEGRHDHPAFSNGITSSEWAEWDPDEREEYLAGAYDVGCELCRGLRVVDVIDEDRLDPGVLEALRRWRQDMADLQAMHDAERRMGA